MSYCDPGYQEAVFEEIEGLLDWAKDQVPDGDSEIVSQVYLNEYPGRSIGGKLPSDVVELGRIAARMAFYGINFNDVDAHQVLYNVGGFWDKIRYEPQF